ncbi:MAG: DDE-type integrase/transposase/recombinase [Candidatus Nitrosocosmicus sp.]
MIFKKRSRTKIKDIVYALHLYFDGLSLRKTSIALSRFVNRSHTAIRDWIQKYKPKKLSYLRKKIDEYIIDETLIKVGSEYFWLWIIIEPKDNEILSITISKERSMLVAEKFLSKVVEKYGSHAVSSDGGTWYPQACRFLKLQHHIHSPFEKSVIERTMQYIKDRTENFDDYFPCRKKNCKLKHVKNWLKLFAHFYNMKTIA